MEISLPIGSPRQFNALSFAARPRRARIHLRRVHRIIHGFLVVLLLTVFGQLIDSPHCLLALSRSTSTCMSEYADFPAISAIPQLFHTSGSTTPAPTLPAHLLHIHGQHVMLFMVIALMP